MDRFRERKHAGLLAAIQCLILGLAFCLSMPASWAAPDVPRQALPDVPRQALPDVPRQALPDVPRQPLPDVDITVDEIVASGLYLPLYVTHAGDGSGRLFVVQKTGKIKIIQNGSVLPTPFLDLTAKVSTESEQGLLGLAFHPDFVTNRRFYVNYTRAGDGATVVARYVVSASDPNQADPASETVVLTTAQPAVNHNGGHLLFGPGGYLYVGIGDGGGAGDPWNNGQDTTTLLGSILRIDVDGGTPYAIPPDNPFVGGPGLDEIWDYGLRNPWRFSLDRLTGDLYIGDVGQNTWEEVDYHAAGTPGGLNFGWRCKEGTHRFNFEAQCQGIELVDPILEYSHFVGRSVTGGYVYRGQDYPDLQGRYFYADYVTGKIWSIYKTGSNPDAWSFPELELESGYNIASFGEDEAGELYIVDIGGGTVRRLADARGSAVNLSRSYKAPSAPGADPGGLVTYTVEVVNTGHLSVETAHLTDTVPAGLSYVPGSLQATEGTWSEGAAPVLTWQGALSPSRQVTVTYQVEATGQVTGSLVNYARLSAPSIAPITLSAALFVPRTMVTTTLDDFFFPGTQPGGLDAAIVPSLDCDICHSAPIYDRWRGSMMAQAGRDPLLWAALTVANGDAPFAGDYCLRCHTARGWLEGRSHPADGSALQPADLSNGVACALCHRLVDPVPGADDEAAQIDFTIRQALTAPVPVDYTGSAALIADPEDRRRGPFSFNLSLPYHTAYQTDFLGQASEAITRARQCGTCHNVDNPALSWDDARGQFWPNDMGTPAPGFETDRLFPIETTFSEWLLSDYARGGVYDPRFAGRKPGGVVEACQDCHMPRDAGIAADPGLNPVARDCETTGCLPVHTMAGGNTWLPQLLQDPRWRLSAESEASYLDQTLLDARTMLRRAATLSATLTTSGTVKIATVRVTNHAGHKLPTGYPEGRQMWLNVRAYGPAGGLLYESGAYDAATGQLQRDADARVYEAKQGITPELATLLDRSPGASFHFVLNNTVVKDNRIPPRGYEQAAYDRPGLRPIGATYADGQNWDEAVYTLPLQTRWIAVRLYYQTASREYVDFLAANGGADGQTLSTLWASHKSPPQLMAITLVPAQHLHLPLIRR